MLIDVLESALDIGYACLRMVTLTPAMVLYCLFCYMPWSMVFAMHSGLHA